MEHDQTHQHVLIIDADPVFCNSVIAMIPVERFDVDCALTIKEASKKMDAHVPDILLLGDHLPDGGSLEFLLHNHDRLNNHHIIFITDDESTALRRQAFDAGVQHFMQKPFDLKKIPEIFNK